MKRKTGIAVLTFIGASTLAGYGVGMSGVAANRTERSGSAVLVLSPYAGAPYTAATNGAYRPSELTYVTEYGTISDVRYEQWSEEIAEGDGLYSDNTCDPTCADANYESARVHFVLDDPVEACGARFFTSLAITPVEGEIGPFEVTIGPPDFKGPDDAEPCS
jgi:hypothetical protein